MHARPKRHARKKRSFFQSPFFMLCMVAISVSAVVGCVGLYQKERVLRAELEKRTAVEEAQRLAYEEIAAEVAYIESDRGKEEAFRTQFDVVKAGEELVIVDIGDVGLDQPVDSMDADQSVTEKAWYEFLLFWR